MRGLMQDRPLALPHVFHRAEQLFGHKPIVTATAERRGRRRRSPSGPCACAGWPRRWTPWASRPTAASGRSAGTPRRTWSSTWRPRAPAGCCTRSTSGCSPSSWSTSPTTPRTTSSSSTARCCRCSSRCGRSCTTVRHVVVIDDGARPPGARRRDRLRGAARVGASRSTAGSTIDDENSAAAMCYTLRHHRQPEGRGLQPPVDAAALADRADGRRARACRSATCVHAGGADVPRQRLGPALRRRCWPGRAWCSPGRT